jgi:uncharacterized membrane protein YeaQ/YmgE (transglycosylase-associated protein family)
MPKTKTIRIKKPSGGTRLQRVQVLASGKYKFIKNTTKGMVRKTRKVGRRAYEKTKKKVKRKTSAPKRKSNKPRKRSDSGLKIPKIPGWLKKAFLGLGGATVGGTVVSYVAPQYVPIARPVVAAVVGGIPGFIAEVVLNSGLLDRFTGIFNGGGINQERLAAGL